MNQKKYKSKYFIKRIFQVVFLTAFIIFFIEYASPVYQKGQAFVVNIFTNKKIIVIGETSLRVEVADTYEKRIKGLSGRESLSPQLGLLFIFDKPERHGIWMKEMNFAIDIIWINEYYEVIYIVKNATPESYPEVFLPPTPSKYVLEVLSGFVKEHNLRIGDKVVFY